MERAYIEKHIFRSEDKKMFVGGPLKHLVRCINPRVIDLEYEKQGEGCEVVHAYTDCTRTSRPNWDINVTGNSLRAIAEAVLAEI